MPKSTPRPTNSTANAIDSRFSEPTIIRPTAVVIDKADEQVDEHREDDLRRMQRHPEDDQHDEHGADAVDDRAVLHGGEYSSLAIGTGPVSRTRAPYSPAKLRSVAACRIASVASLPGSSALIVEDRLELDEGAPVGIGQRLVADEFAPGEGRGALVQHVLDRLRDQVEGPRGVVELDLPALDAGKPGFQRAGQAADRGIAGHDLDQGRGGFELAGDLADLFHRQEQQPVLFEELAGAERLNRFEMLGVARELCGQRRGSRRWSSSGVGASTTARISSFAVECLLELVVALAPVQVGRNQRVDVGVDGEVPGRVEARPDRQDSESDNDESGKPRAGSDNRDNNTCQHIFSF